MTQPLGIPRLNGSCPVCGTDVPRVSIRWTDGPRELFKCPEHGPIEYGRATTTLLEAPPLARNWGHGLVWDV